MKKLFYSIATIICTISIASCCNSNTPRRVTEAYLDDLLDGNYDAVVNRTHFRHELSPEKKQELIEVITTNVTESIEKGKQFTGYKIVREKISKDGQKAIVTYTAICQDGLGSDSELKFIKIDGKWFVDKSN